MMNSDLHPSPFYSGAWKKLESQYKNLSPFPLKSIYNSDNKRFNSFSIRFNDILFDYSKSYLTYDTRNTLIELCNESKLKEGIESYFIGDKINKTENRAVLHTALRSSSPPDYVDGEAVAEKIELVKHKIKDFSTRFYKGNLKGYTGKVLKTIVNIGIGGSDLGPRLICDALSDYANSEIDSYFVSNVDGTDLTDVLKVIDAETSLFIIASKTFTTQETMTNALKAKAWLINCLGSEDAIPLHFVAVSTNTAKVVEFGISEANMFEFWDWVGGRFSLWSSIGLSICCSLGYNIFTELLKGAESADNHFRTSGWQENIPVIMALTGIVYRNIFNLPVYAVLPYSQRLQKLPVWLQQVDMESNGKSVDKNGEKVSWQTGPVVFGEAGTNGQHAFYQLIHQGTLIIPCDFIGVVQNKHSYSDMQDILLSHLLAQSSALMMGKSLHETEAEFEKNSTPMEIRQIQKAHKVFEGNRPSNMFLLKELNANNLGALLAFYEHKIFVQGYLWNIFSYDQWGVELGKQLAGKILPSIADNAPIDGLDGSTQGLLGFIKDCKNGRS